MLGSIISSVVSGVLVAAIVGLWTSPRRKYFMDTLVMLLVSASLKLLPSSLKAEYHDIWWQHIVEQHSAHERLREALGLVLGSLLIGIAHKVESYRVRLGFEIYILSLRMQISVATEEELDEWGDEELTADYKAARQELERVEAEFEKRFGEG